MKTNNIPNEVAWVLCVQMGQIPLGRDGYEKAQSIIEKYPEHFPWEHKYKSIPKEVHEAFEAECYPERGKSVESLFDDLEVGDSLREQVKNQKSAGVIPTKLTKDDFVRMLDEMEEAERKRKEEERAEEVRVKKIWDKHYKRYNLKYRL
jgi:hypothetical protein